MTDTHHGLITDGGQSGVGTARGQTRRLGPFEFETPDRDCRVSDCDEKADGVVDMQDTSVSACIYCAPQFLQHDYADWTPLAGARSLESNPKWDTAQENQS